MDGSTGGDLFSTISVEAIRSQTTSADVDLELAVTDANKLPSNGLDLTYSAETEMWTLSNSDWAISRQGKEVSLRPGFEISLSGSPRGGDNFKIVPGSNTAGQIKFLLTRPHDFAAASPDLITASNSNQSDAELSLRRIDVTGYPDHGDIHRYSCKFIICRRGAGIYK